MEDNTLVESSFSATVKARFRESGYSLLVLCATRVGIPTLVPRSLLRWCNHGA